MPLAAINKFLFCHATIRIEDVLGALVPRYSRATNAMKKSLDREYQERVLSKDPVTGEVSGVIVDIIKELTEEELQDFIWFVTGWKYVPRSGLTITVEFNHVEAKEDSLPVAHTCTQDLKLPGEAYKAEKETLKEKLKTSIEEVKQGSHFDMN
jgi:HECT-domain (ubiquitin-transferase)